jgi:hypothetical protein
MLNSSLDMVARYGVLVARHGICLFILGCGGSIWDVAAQSGMCQLILGYVS